MPRIKPRRAKARRGFSLSAVGLLILSLALPLRAEPSRPLQPREYEAMSGMLRKAAAATKLYKSLVKPEENPFAGDFGVGLSGVQADGRACSIDISVRHAEPGFFKHGTE